MSETETFWSFESFHRHVQVIAMLRAYPMKWPQWLSDFLGGFEVVAASGEPAGLKMNSCAHE